MNKKYLLILAALGLKGGAWAQSQVTLQGTTDVYIQSASTGATHFTGEGEGGSAASRLAFRGSEDLGGGLRVNDNPVTDEKMVLTSANFTPEGLIKLSLGKKKHVLLRPA